MTLEDTDPKKKAEHIIYTACVRIERMCRYSPLDTEEGDSASIADRNTVSSLYKFYRDRGNSEKTSGILSRIDAARLVLYEMLQ